MSRLPVIERSTGPPRHSRVCSWTMETDLERAPLIAAVGPLEVPGRSR